MAAAYAGGQPPGFATIARASEFCRGFFCWYNHEHRHSGVGLMTPAAVGHGRAPQLHGARVRVLEAAHAARLDRFVRGMPKPPTLPMAASTTPTEKKEATH